MPWQKLRQKTLMIAVTLHLKSTHVTEDYFASIIQRVKYIQHITLPKKH